jgi:hypothetical protein
MTNAVKLLYNQGNTKKNKQYELTNIYNEFKHYELYEIFTYNSKQIHIFSRTLDIRVRRSLALPTQVSDCHLI